MIWYLIKNNLKLMFRNKVILVVMVLGPVFVIAMLSSAFDDLMKSYESPGSFQAGYQVEEGSFWEDNIESIKKAGEEAGIKFTEYPEGNPEELVKSDIIAGFAELGSEKYTVYENEDKKIEGTVLEYFLNQCLQESISQTIQAGIYNTGARDFKQGEISGAINKDFKIPVQEIDYMPAVDASDYYGIIEIVYFSFLGIICVANVFTSEKKNRIEQRFQMTSLSCFKLYLAKWIPAIIVTSAGALIASVLTAALFSIHWGNFLISAIIILLVIIASSAFGLMLYAISKNMAVTVIILFTSVFFMGLFGGSFETYIYSSMPEILKNISPVYYVNRVLVEYSCMGHSNYTLRCILYMAAITIICTGTAVLADWTWKRGKERE